MPYRLQCPSRADTSLIKSSHLIVPHRANYINQNLQPWATQSVELTPAAAARCGIALGEHLLWMNTSVFCLGGSQVCPTGKKKSAEGVSSSPLCWPAAFVCTAVLSDELTHNVTTTSPFFGCQTLNERKLGWLEGCHLIPCQREFSFLFFFFFSGVAKPLLNHIVNMVSMADWP